MVERVTALLAQAAATILVVIGLVAVLAFTHSQAYEAGYCATRHCPEGESRSPAWWPFGQQTRRTTPSDPDRVVIRPGDYGAGDRYYADPDPRDGYVQGGNDFSGLPPSGTITYPGSDTYSDTGSDRASGSSGSGFSFPLGAGASGLGSSYRRPSFYSYDPGGRICASRSYGVADADIARCWLNVGDAYQAVGRIEDARDAWDQALLIGSTTGGSQSSLTAHRRLQAAILERSCPTTPQSLARIAYGFSETEDDGDIIELEQRQRALSALGYYPGDVDGSYGPMTRRSVRDFQGDMGFDQTGALTPSETVTLMCHAALTARDTHAQNLLGIMFATGLGLEQNIDTALEWLESAAERGHGGANFNLALIYGTGTVQGSYRLCGIVESPERAESYLRQAAELGHPRAVALRQYAGRRGTPAERWSRISEQLLTEAERTGDRFYLAWQRRVDEMRRANGAELNLPGCYQAALDGQASAGGGETSGSAER
ncbi:peptidoglycan-binding protein [Maricaulis parjimensis]|uniref:peptidoglycan-binding protein n=1 Tax=Maricaulis parjimensis TaxID=144023 RepID=UPI0019397773|nr:peptidoglycan-binding protein [Maricaulis parjimensis]